MIGEFERVWNYIRFGEPGDYVENEKNGRKIIRKSNGRDTLPTCYCVENYKPIGTTYGLSAINWLYGYDDEMTRPIEEL